MPTNLSPIQDYVVKDGKDDGVFCLLWRKKKRNLLSKFNGDLRKTISKKNVERDRKVKKKIREKRRNLSFILTDYTFPEEGHAECQSYEKISSHMHVCVFSALTVLSTDMSTC